MAIYGYARCSTNEDFQDISRQVLELKKLGVEEANIFREYISGTSKNKIELDRLLNLINAGDTIIATEVSRITRSTKQLCELIELAKDKKIKLIFGSFIVDFTGARIDPMVEGMLKLMGVFAELERNIISDRVRSGLENAKSKDVKLGRPGLTLDKLPKQFLKHYPTYLKKDISLTELSALCGKTRKTVYKYIKVIEESK